MTRNIMNQVSGTTWAALFITAFALASVVALIAKFSTLQPSTREAITAYIVAIGACEQPPTQ